MTIQDATIAKIEQLPDSLAQEVSDYIDFLLLKQDDKCWQQWMQFSESLTTSESDFSDYLKNLEDYEERLVHGEIKW